MLKLIFGSHLYGMDTPESDTDYKGIFLPSADELLLNQVPKTITKSTGSSQGKNTSEDVDFEAFSIYEFVRLALKGETVALDMLHARQEHIVQSENVDRIYWADLQNYRTMFYSKDMSSYLGYVRRQAAKYGVKGGRLAAAREVLETIEDYFVFVPVDTKLKSIKDSLPVNEYCEWISETDPRGVTRNFYQVCGRKLHDEITIFNARSVANKIVEGYGHRAKKAEQNEGIDWKAVSHALRAGYQLRDIYKEGDFEYPLYETKFLIEVKTGKHDFKEVVQPELESLVKECEDLSTSSRLPEKPDKNFWEVWLIETIEELVL